MKSLTNVVTLVYLLSDYWLREGFAVGGRYAAKWEKGVKFFDGERSLTLP
jgi:hypothetical protein